MSNGLKFINGNGETRNTKFDFNSLLSRQQQSADGATESMNVSSESPIPIDDGNSRHSASDNGDEGENGLKQESTSSPDLSVDMNMNGSTASTLSLSPKPRVTPSSGPNGGGVVGLAPGIARSRLMFDPLTELPLLEKWFEENPHPSWIQIDQYTETLNSYPYRQSYPPISTHNVKIWFKNRRAKCKRMLGTDVVSK